MGHRSSRWVLWCECARGLGRGRLALPTRAACAAYSPFSVFFYVLSCSTRPARLWLLHLFLPFPLVSLSLLPSLTPCFGPPDLSAARSDGLVSRTSVGQRPKGHESNRRGCLPAVSSNVWSLADGSSSYRGNPANLL